MLVSFSYAFESNIVIKNRRKLKLRIQKITRWLRGVSKAIGKFKLSIKRIRFYIYEKDKKKAYKVIFKQKLSVLMKYCKIWLHKHKHRLAKKIANTIEKMISSYSFTLAMSIWRKNVKNIIDIKNTKIFSIFFKAKKKIIFNSIGFMT